MLDDSGIRPPLLAAGINLFGGALGLLHKHVTGAVPIRRNSKDPLYLVTLRAYIAELLKERDLLYYAEGGRSYTGELKAPEDRPAAGGAQAEPRESVDRADGGGLRPRARRSHPARAKRAASASGRSRRKSPRWCGTRSGYESRAFVTFASADSASARSIPDSRRDLVTLAHRVHDDDRPQPQSLPTALVASVMRPHMSRIELHCAPRRSPRHARRRSAPTSPCKSGRQAARRGRVAPGGARRARRGRSDLCACATASSLRYYARIDRAPADGASKDHALMLDALPKAAFSLLASSNTLKRLASRYGMRRPAVLRGGSSPARRRRKPSTPRARSSSRA